jgi:hypothetical protein
MRQIAYPTNYAVEGAVAARLLILPMLRQRVINLPVIMQQSWLQPCQQKLC